MSDINIFVGKNGSGKSTILEPIFLTSHIFKTKPDPDIYQEESSGDNTKVGFLSKKRNLRSLHSRDIYHKPDQQATKHYTAFSLNDKDWWYAGENEKEIKFVFKMDGGKIEVKVSKSEGARLIGYQFQPDIEEYLSNAIYLDASLAYRKDIEKVAWDHILTKALKKDIISKFNSIFPLTISDIDYSSKGFYITPVDAKFGIYLDNLGAGMRIAIRLLMVLGIFKNTAVLLEEFDAYEHPESLRNLIDIIFKASEDNHLQFFLTTHRLESIRSFLELFENYPEINGTITGTALGTDGELQARPISFHDAKNLFEGGFDFRNIEDYV